MDRTVKCSDASDSVPKPAEVKKEDAPKEQSQEKPSMKGEKKDKKPKEGGKGISL